MQGNELRWPAEWEQQVAVWLSWPHRDDLWQGGLQELHSRYAELAAAIAQEAEVRINAAAPLHAGIERLLRELGVQRFALYDHPTNDVWCRDHGPIFTKRADGGMQLANWTFNAWGGKFAPWDLDNEVPARIAESLGLPVVPNTCPEDESSKRAEIKALLANMAKDYPDLKSKVFGAMQRQPLPGWKPEGSFRRPLPDVTE